MPTYRRGVSPDPDWVGLDKLSITFPRSGFWGTRDNVAEVVYGLADSVHFQRSNDAKARLWSPNGEPNPLLSGEVRFNWSQRDRRYNVRLTLRPNLTRIIAHLQGRLPSSVEDEELLARLIAPLAPTEALTSMSLDGNDNMLPAYRAWALRGVNWGSELRHVVRVVLDFIAGEIETRTSELEGQARFRADWREWYLDQCELYWEFQSEDALSQVRLIANHLDRLSVSVDRRLFLPAERLDDEQPGETFAEDGVLRPSTSRRGAALEVLLEGGRKNLLLAVYAKAADRMRFEVRYLRQPRSFIPREWRQSAGSNTSLRGLEDFFQVLSSSDAVHRVGALMREVDALGVQVVRDHASLPRLLTELARACQGDFLMLEAFVTSLCVHGCIANIGRDEQRRAIRRLRTRGVLRASEGQPVRRLVTLLPTEHYLNAVEALRAAIGMSGPHTSAR